MLARLVKTQKDIRLLCWDGTIETATPHLIKRFLTEFKQIEDLTGKSGMRLVVYPPEVKRTKEIAQMYEYMIETYPGTTLAYISNEKVLHVLDPMVFQDVLAFMAPNEYLTTREYADKHGVSEGRVKALCQEGRLPGAMHKGHQWLIPRSAKYPEDRRVKCKY